MIYCDLLYASSIKKPRQLAGPSEKMMSVRMGLDALDCPAAYKASKCQPSVAPLNRHP